MKLVAMLRVKNEMPVIAACLTKLSELADEIVVLDNGSTDGTLELYPSFPKIVAVLKTEGYHDGRDKYLLLLKAKERNPDWIIWTDGDEVFEDACTRKVMEQYMRSRYNRIRFRMYTFWLNEKSFRIDGTFLLYTLEPQRSMWRNAPEAYFSNKKMHPGDIRGIRGASFISPFRIKHYGYPTHEKIGRKYHAYESEDTDGIRTYEHLHPAIPVRLLPFREHKNLFIRHAYINIYSYTASILLFIMRVYNKGKRLLYDHL